MRGGGGLKSVNKVGGGRKFLREDRNILRDVETRCISRETSLYEYLIAIYLFRLAETMLKGRIK